MIECFFVNSFWNHAQKKTTCQVIKRKTEAEKNKTTLLKENILITKILERQNQSENTISKEIKMLANKQIILTNSQKVDKKEKINS